MLPNNTLFEQKLFQQGFRYIAGVDEVGRGPLAGPLVVCAVVLDLEKVFESFDTDKINDVAQGKNDVKNIYSLITDSKLISDKLRRTINEKLKSKVISYSIVQISNIEIDKTGIAASTKKAFYNAVKKLKIVPDHIITDLFSVADFPKEKQTNLKKGDKLSISVGAGSILAKVFRDDLMLKYHVNYPKYGFGKHKGYGTKQHLIALEKYGPSPIHRLSFRPISQA